MELGTEDFNLHQDHLYLDKYYNKAFFRYLLTRKKIYIPSYKNFDDPAEFPFFRKHSIISKNTIYSQETIGHNYYVLCLTNQNPPQNTNMWENYAKNGTKIKFNTTKLIESIQQMLITLEKKIQLNIS